MNAAWRSAAERQDDRPRELAGNVPTADGALADLPRDFVAVAGAVLNRIENIMLALAVEGLYGCTYTPYQAAGLKEHLGIPAGYELAAVIPFGYAAQPPTPRIPEDPTARLRVDKW